MHWFWRGAIAVIPGIMCCLFFWLWQVWDIESLARNEDLTLAVILGSLLRVVFFSALALITFAVLTRQYRPTTSVPETRCRKCHYILKGITEPRCPECGEGI